MLEFLIVFIWFIESGQAGQFNTNLIISAHKTFPLLTSSVNAGDYADYNFLFRVPSNIVSPCFLEIIFPEESFVSGMGMHFLPQIEVYNPTLIAQTASPTVSEKTLRVYPERLISSEDVSLIIREIKNPFKIGGIGLFEVYTKCQNQIIQVNRNFANIGITEPKTEILSSSVDFDEGASPLAGEESRYVFRIVPTTDVSPYSVFQIEFPAIYNLTKIREETDDFPSYKPCQVSAPGVVTPFSNNTKFDCTIIGNDNVILITGLSDSWLTRNR
jgi:hypothetical protein